MEPERWQEVKAALADAIALGEAERAAYLERLTVSDPGLGAEVGSLLQADREAGARFLESPAAAVLEAAAPASPQTGRRLGCYRLLEEIGAGGMGEVYRAVRDDQEYEHQVAVKLVRAGADAQLVGPRLRAERQILAAFQHPHIARLLDGGTTDDGIPYLVMELIDGQPITEYCDRRRLDLEARLRLFLLVCSAVQYAHQHAVIHRDLKPSNILVTADGAPKLLDFGIAKIVEPGTIPVRAGLTIAAVRLLTPDYASPEQLTGEPVTAASDVYSLGVILYELLTGTRPRGVTAAQSVPRATPGPAPTRPSIVVRSPDTAGAAVGRDSTGRLSRHLRGDLDNIVLMALREEPQRRYPTVDRLAEDIRRHLARLPVTARRPTLRYRSATFVTRHKVGVAAGVVTALALVAGVVMTARETLIARAALARAQDEASASERVSDYLESLFEEANPQQTGGKPLDVRALVARAQRQIDPQLASRPELRARMLSAVGALHCQIGQFDPCEQDLEQALRIELGAGPAGDPLLRAETEYRLANAYNDAGRTREALVLLGRALPVLAAQRPADTQAVAGVWKAIGRAYLETEPLRAIAALQQARTLERGPHGEDTVASADTLGTLAIADAQALRFDDALALARTRLQLVSAHYNTADARYVDALNDYAEVAQEAGRFREARLAWERVLTGYERIFGRTSNKYIDTELSLGDVLFRRNRLRESIFWFRRAVSDYRAQQSQHRERYIGSLFALSQVLWMHGDYRAAAEAAREGYRASRQTTAPTPQASAIYRMRLAHPLAFVGETRRALALLAAPMPGDRRSALSSTFEGLRLLWLADTYRQSGANARAEQAYAHAVVYLRAHSPPHSAALSMAYEGEALLLAGEQRFADAVPLYELAITGYAASQYAPDGPSIAAARVELADSLASLGRATQARALIATAGAIVAAGLAPAHPARIALRRLRRTLRIPSPTRVQSDG
jgi:eukaryotic-like serine/threonine-protein kinase